MTARQDKVVVYRDKAGGWRWRYVRGNGRVMADSAESYQRRGACINAATRVTLVGISAHSEARLVVDE